MFKRILEILSECAAQFDLLKHRWLNERELLIAELKTHITKALKRRKKRVQRVFEDPRKFLKWVFYVIVLIKLRATPSNIKYFFSWYMWVGTASFIRSSLNIITFFNWNHKSALFYLVVNFIVFFLLKLYQEVYYNFSCAVAVIFYGRFHRTDRPYLQKKKEREERAKLKRVKKKQYATRAERLKAIADWEIQVERMKPNEYKTLLHWRYKLRAEWLEWKRDNPGEARVWLKKRFRKK